MQNNRHSKDFPHHLQFILHVVYTAYIMWLRLSVSSLQMHDRQKIVYG